MKPVLMGRAGRWIVGPIIALMIGASSFGENPEDWGADSPTAASLGEKFMKSIFDVQASTSVTWLNDVKGTLTSVANGMAQSLQDKRAKVEFTRDEIISVDDSIQAEEKKIKGTADANVIAQAQNAIASLNAKRAKLVTKEAADYKLYARQRGKCIVARILFEAIIKEADKRIGELAINTAGGTWAGVYVGDDGKKEPQGGRFSLFIDSKTGAITGDYTEGGGRVAVGGKWDANSGVCSGTGSDPETPATFNGKLSRGTGGYTGGGTFSYTHKSGGSGSGTWTTK